MTLDQIREHWGCDENPAKRCQYTIVYDYRVMAVAVVDLEYMEWTVYIAGVRGENHDLEWLDVRREGSHVGPKLADYLFPNMPDTLTYSADV